MKQNVTIVMYHYVRDLERSRFPAIKGLSTERFRRQLDHLQAKYTLITTEELIAALDAKVPDLPDNAALLTFDDGYIDHFTTAFPLLEARGIKGAFFPPAQAILDHIVLDVNKIHFVLASGRDPNELLDQVLQTVAKIAPDHPVESKQAYLKKLGGDHRYDTPEVTTLKRLLQRELPEPIRRAATASLFKKHVTSDETAFACELYMSVDQIACLKRHGMHIGGHGHAHVWLNHISPEAQAAEADLTLKFLQVVGVKNNSWTMCHPYGGYNDSLLEILRARHCRLGFAVENRVANLETDDRLTLPRLDTNDLPS